MLALFFEVTPKPGHDDQYFGIAAALKPQVDKNGGLLFLDRYRSLTRPETILSYQHWLDEAALVKWREDAKHMQAQKAGRETHFADYRIRIGDILDGFSSSDGSASRDDLGATDHESHMGASLVMAVESTGRPFPRGESFKSVNRDGVHVSVLHVANAQESSEILRDARTQDYVTGAIQCAIVRDYGMFERDEAPQDAVPLKAPGTAT